MKSTLQRFLHAPLLIAACCSASSAFAIDAVTLQLKSTHSFEFAGYYAAIAQGYYAEAGLTVTLKEAQAGVDVAAEVATGKAEYATGSSSLLLEHNAGRPVVLLAVIFQHSPYLLLARQTQSIHDLVDKKMMMEPQANELLAYLNSEGLPLERLNLLAHSLDPQDLINGTVDAISASSIYQPYYLDRANFNYQSYSPRSVGFDFYGDNLFTSEREIKQHPERVKAFRAASMRGWQYAMAHTEEITSLIVNKYSQRHPRQFFLYQAKQMHSLMHPELIEIGDINLGRWRHIADTYATIGLLPDNYAFTGFIHNQPIKFNRKKLYYTLAISLTIFASVAGFYWYRRKPKVPPSKPQENAPENQNKQQQFVHSNILELLGNGAPLNTILDVIVKEAEQSNPGTYCSISILNNAGTHLLTGAAPSLPDYFNQAMNGIEIGLGIASCGTAAFTGQRVLVEDTQTHPYWSTFKSVCNKARLLSCWSEPILSTNGKVLGTFALYHRKVSKATEADTQFMTKTANVAALALDRSRAQQTLKENEKLMTDILENVSAYIYMKDRQGRYLFANRLLRELFTAPMEEIIGFDDSKFYDVTTAAYMRLSDLQVLDKGTTLRSEESTPNPLTGHTSIYLTIKLPLRHDDGSIYALCGIATDITEQKEIEERMRRMAQYDALTNMPNRALLEDRLQHTFTAAKRTHEHFGLMFIDLDKFKPINDTYGHAVGDSLLKEAAQRMQSCVRESDTVARVGGDEFVVLLASLKVDQDAQDVAEKVRHALNLPFEISGHTLNISSSIGVAIYPAHGENEKELVKHADLAMYYAKENGRNNVTVYHAGLKDSK